jgi:hypothetical protein
MEAGSCIDSDRIMMYMGTAIFTIFTVKHLHQESRPLLLFLLLIHELFHIVSIDLPEVAPNRQSRPAKTGLYYAQAHFPVLRSSRVHACTDGSFSHNIEVSAGLSSW